jgi:hypothetical protein
MPSSEPTSAAFEILDEAGEEVPDGQEVEPEPEPE